MMARAIVSCPEGPFRDLLGPASEEPALVAD